MLLLLTVGVARGGPYAHAPLSPWRTVAYQPGAPAGIFFEPQRPVRLAFELENVSADSMVPGRFVCRVVRTRALAGNPRSIWDAPFRNVERLAEWPLDALMPNAPGELLPGRTQGVVLELIPAKYGHFSVMVAPRGAGLDEGYRAATFAVVHPPVAGPQLDSPFLATADDTMGRGATAHLDIPARYGIKWLRLALAPAIDAAGHFDWSTADKIAAALRVHGLLALNDLSTWNGPVPTIGGKPVSYFWGRKANLIPDPKDFPLYGRQVEQVVGRYGDVAPAGYMRNEPWEGGSISFYHGTGKYYGEWLQVATGAAKRVAPDFPVLAADAISNFEDNIQMRGLTHLVDITSHHAGLEFNRGAVQSAVLGKRAWETEDWLSHYDAYLIANLTLKLAHGYEKSNPGDPGLYLTQPGHNGHPDWRYVPNGNVLLPAPAGQAVSTWLHFIEGTRFRREINPDHLPWMFLFDAGEAEGARHAAVVIGRIKAYGYDYHEEHGDVAWPTVTALGRLRVEDPERTLTVCDFSGNALARETDGGYVIPLTEDAHYVVSTLGPADVAAKLKAAQADYEGNPLQVSLKDFTRPLASKPAVRVKVRNCIQATMDAEIRVVAPAGWRLVEDRQVLPCLRPGEVRELVFAVEAAHETPANRYPFKVEAVTPAGRMELTENLHVTYFRRGTITVDGDLSDWADIGAMPVTLAGSAKTDSVEKYWLPFIAHAEGSAAPVRFAGAWDEDHFYVCAEVRDAHAQYRPSMRDGIYYTLHDAPLDYLYWGVTPRFVSTIGDGLKIAFDVHRAGQKNDPWLPPEAQLQVDGRFDALSADYEYDLYAGATNRLAEPYPVVRDRHLARLAHPPDASYRGHWPPFEEPTFVTEGEPRPEIWRLMAPGVPRHNYYPFSDRPGRDQGLVPGAQLVVQRTEFGWRYEAAIPWRELAEIAPEVGREVRFSFSVLNDGKRAAAWTAGRSSSGARMQILHPTWQRNEAIETVWSFEDFAP